MILIVVILITVLILAIFAYQNWTLVPPLVFLGMQSKSLPLALLILLAFGCGFVTIVLLQLLQEININQILASIEPEPETAKVTDHTETTKQAETVESSPINNTKYQNNPDDWEEDKKEDNQTSQDWEDVIDDLESPPKNTEDIPKKPNQNRPPAVYSYSYPQDKNSSSKKTDRVYDADYRVIKPNYEQQQQQQQQSNNNDDWNVKNPSNQDDDWEF